MISLYLDLSSNTTLARDMRSTFCERIAFRESPRKLKLKICKACKHLQIDAANGYYARVTTQISGESTWERISIPQPPQYSPLIFTDGLN